MKVTGSFITATLALAGSALSQATGNTAVFESPVRGSFDTVELANSDVVALLARKFDVADNFKYAVNSTTAKVFSKLISNVLIEKNKNAGLSSKFIVIVNGVSHPSEFYANLEPQFRIPDEMVSTKPMFLVQNDQSANTDLVDTVFDKFSDFLGMFRLTHDLKGSLAHDYFKHFDSKLNHAWKKFKSTFIDQQSATDLYENPFVINLINDKLFMSEVTQLTFLQSEEYVTENFFFKSNALLSIANKVGTDSVTYKFASRVIADLLVDIQSQGSMTTIAVPFSRESVLVNQKQMNKRSKQIETLFALRDGASTDPAALLFSSEEECEVATNKCSSHGTCSKISSGSWTCLCSSTFDNKKGKTTNWTGYDCSKQDVASVVNLLLWTSVSLVVLMVGGVKLLYSVGLDPLPGVLDSATSVKKST